MTVNLWKKAYHALHLNSRRSDDKTEKWKVETEKERTKKLKVTESVIRVYRALPLNYQTQAYKAEKKTLMKIDHGNKCFILAKFHHSFPFSFSNFCNYTP